MKQCENCARVIKQPPRYWPICQTPERLEFCQVERLVGKCGPKAKFFKEKDGNSME